MNSEIKHGVRFQHGFTLQEALDMAYIDDAEEVFTALPDASQLTDEDSGDEDGGGTLNNLNGRQLQAEVEIKLVNSLRVNCVDVEEGYWPDKINLTDKISWIKNGDLEESKRLFPIPTYDSFKTLSYVEIFEQFIDSEIIEFLTDETQKYALFKNFPDPKITANEMRCFIAILILSGYDQKPGKRFYWDISNDMRNLAVVEAMRRDRGTYVSAIDKDHGIMFAKWADNNVVTAASTCHGVEPMGSLKRFSKAEKKYVKVPRPNIIGEYNNCMGGTDLMDENVSAYRISIRSKKWWWCIFTWLIDVSINNAWILHRKATGTQTSQLDFRRDICQTYLRRYGTLPKGGGRPSTSKMSISLNRVSDDLRYDELNHLLACILNNKRRRCAGEGCSTSARTMCQKCNVGLCLECNVICHTQTARR